jgi:hypothetical protein
MSIRDLSFDGLPNDVTIPVVVHILYKAGSDTRSLPSEIDVKKQLDITSKDFCQTQAQYDKARITWVNNTSEQNYYFMFENKILYRVYLKPLQRSIFNQAAYG